MCTHDRFSGAHWTVRPVSCRAPDEPDHGEILEWVRSLPGPVAVVYEAGPTGYRSGPVIHSAGINCVVAAPSKLHPAVGRSSQDRCPRRAAFGTVLHLDESAAVTVPSVEQEAARDLVRAREDCRGDLMAVRHRLSKLLLRHGIVYCGGEAWSRKHELWLRSTGSTMLVYSWPTMRPLMRCWPPLTAATASMRRSSRWPPIRSSPRSVTRLGCLRGVSTLTAFGLATEIGDWHRLPAVYRRLLGSGAHRVLLGGNPLPGWGHQDRQQPCPAAADRGGLASPASPIDRDAIYADAGKRRPRQPEARGQAANRRLHARWARFDSTTNVRGRQRCGRPRAGRLVLVLGCPRRLKQPQLSRWVDDAGKRLTERHASVL